jgi:hypothetical protein
MSTSANPMPSPMFFAFVGCTSLEEVRIAAEALAQHRAVATADPLAAAGPVGKDALLPPHRSLADRIEGALNAEPLNEQRKLLLEILVASPADAWLSFDTMRSKFTANGLKETQASAALRDLSWILGEHLPANDTAGLDVNIIVLAERSRNNGVMNYRLTQAGRTAVQAFLATRSTRYPAD